MPFTIVRNDITAMAVDAIVNTANPRPVIGLGVDSAIHEEAGPELLQARQKIGDIARGCADITPAYNLPAKYVIHTVGPAWVDGAQNEEILLRSCYENSLRLALEHNCYSIAFPLISTGTYGFPKDKALQIAINTFSSFLLAHEMQIYLVVFDSASYRLSEKLFQSVASYIDQHYVDICASMSYAVEERRAFARRRRDIETNDSVCMEAACIAPSVGAPCKAISLEDMLKKADAGFTETLLKLIDKTRKKIRKSIKKPISPSNTFLKSATIPTISPPNPLPLLWLWLLRLNWIWMRPKI